MQVRVCLSILTGVITLIGCKPGNEVDVSLGTYEYSDKVFIQRVTIRRDGSYTNEIGGQGLPTKNLEGTWSKDAANSTAGITFEKFVFAEKQGISGLWFVTPAKSMFGRTKLCFDLDLDRCFELKS